MIQLAILIFGIVILCRRRVSLSKKRVVTGAPAIAIGVIFVSILPLSFVLGIFLGVVMTASGVGEDRLFGYALAVDFGLLALAIVAALAIALSYSRDPNEQQQEPLHENRTNAPYDEPADPSNPYNAPRQ